MKYLIVCALGVLIFGCSTVQPKFKETPECSNYRGMMTAPMPPDETNKLKLKCEQSDPNWVY